MATRAGARCSSASGRSCSWRPATSSPHALPRTCADKRDRLKAQYTLAEAGQGAHISLLTGRATAIKHTLTASKTLRAAHDYIFPPRVFTELQNAQAIALPYDGLNPLPPQYCYLKPHYLDVQTSYFDHVARGAL